MNNLDFHSTGERPNTYTYTKAIAEHLIAEEAAKEEDPAKRIPMAIGLLGHE